MTPLVSIIMPVFNASRFLRDAIESILNQTYTDFEFIILDDKSTDDSLSIIQLFDDPRIKLFRNDINLGVTRTLNKAIELANGEYIARMDADDIADTMRIEKQVKYLIENPNTTVISSLVELIDCNNDSLGFWQTDQENRTEDQIKSTLCKTNCIAHPTTMVRSSILKKFLYRIEKNSAEDYDLWLRLISHGYNINKINEVLLKYRVYQGSVTSNAKKIQNSNLRVFHQKKQFLLYAITNSRINIVFFSILYSSCRSYAAYLKDKLPYFLSAIKRLLTCSPIKVIRQYKNLNQILSNCKAEFIFFFPYTHMGGAEKVHAEITRVFSDFNVLIIFTGFSKDDLFLSKYKSDNCTIVNTPDCLYHPISRAKTKQTLLRFLHSRDKLYTFGSNSGYYLDLLPLMPDNAICTDIIHAFKFQPGANLAHIKYLVPTLRLNHRVFISQNAMLDFIQFLRFHQYGPEISDRLVYIKNFTVVPQHYLPKLGTTKIIFVGRNSPEKRFSIFISIADQISKVDPSFAFEVAGFSSNTLHPNITFRDELNDNELNSLYQSAHYLILCSDREGFPLVVMEAMANGVIPICTDVGDIGRHINSSNGVLITETSNQAIVDSMIQHILHINASIEMRKTYSESAYLYAKENFTYDDFRSSYRHLVGLKN